MNSGASFSAAIAWLKAGYKVRRAAWPEGQFLFVDPVAGVQAQYGGHGKRYGSGHDILAEDWQLIRE